MSKIIESLRGDLAALVEAGAIGKVTMREFDAICPPPVREFGAALNPPHSLGEARHLRPHPDHHDPVRGRHRHRRLGVAADRRQLGLPDDAPGRRAPAAARAR